MVLLNASLPTDLQGVWIDRDLSWLDFNERVLAEALDERTPLLERAKFLAIFTSNLDEFFMKREAVLRLGTTDAQRAFCSRFAISSSARCGARRNATGKPSSPVLPSTGSFCAPGTSSLPANRKRRASISNLKLSPALTPLVIDPVHPFPFLSNLSTSLVFRLRDVARDESMFARVKVPGVIKQWVSLESGSRARTKAAGSATRGHSRKSAQPLHRHGNQQRHHRAADARRRGGGGR